MLSNFGLRRRDEIIPNGHEHVKRCCPDRSPFAAMEENRHPFVFLLGSRPVHKNVEMLFSIAGELDPLGSRVTLPCNPRKLYMMERPLDTQALRI